MLKSRSSLPRRTCSSSGDSVRTASCSSLESARGRPLTLTMMSPSWMPPLPTGETRGHSTAPRGPGPGLGTVGFNSSTLGKFISTGKDTALTARLSQQTESTALQRTSAFSVYFCTSEGLGSRAGCSLPRWAALGQVLCPFEPRFPHLQPYVGTCFANYKVQGVDSNVRFSRQRQSELGWPPLSAPDSL